MLILSHLCSAASADFFNRILFSVFQVTQGFLNQNTVCFCACSFLVWNSPGRLPGFHLVAAGVIVDVSQILASVLAAGSKSLMNVCEWFGRIFKRIPSRPSGLINLSVGLYSCLILFEAGLFAAHGGNRNLQMDGPCSQVCCSETNSWTTATHVESFLKQRLSHHVS